MKRRNFISSAALAGTVALIPQKLLATPTDVPKRKPPKLNKGDVVGLIAPGSGVGRESFEEAVATVERLGFTPYFTNNIRVKNRYLAGTDKQRIDDIHHMFENSKVKGILCLRGGYGSNRLLPYLDYTLIKNNPKVLMGYSDISALLFGIYSQTGLVGFHGPVAISSFNEYATQHFNKVVVKAKSNIKIVPPKAWEQKEETAYIPLKIYTGKAKGELVGGNLSVISSLIGSPYDLDFSDKIVFLEEIEEPPYKIDRMLTQMLLAGKLQKAAGIALGVFRDCDYLPNDPHFEESFSLAEVLQNRLSDLGIPVVYGLPFGHIADNATLPIGIAAELDADNAILTLLEKAVV